jgi:hypothetical protein
LTALDQEIKLLINKWQDLSHNLAVNSTTIEHAVRAYEKWCWLEEYKYMK